MKTVRINFTMDEFLQLLDWADEHRHDSEIVRLLDDRLTEKLDRLICHELFTASKTAPTPEARAEARKKYLDERQNSH